MTRFKTAAAMFALFAASFAPSVRADGRNKETRLIIDQPLQVQNTVLAPGEYIFKLTMPDSNHSIVSIFNADGSRLEAIVTGFSVYRADAADKKLFTFSKPQGNQPSALKSWFYRGDNFGVEFPVKN
jgi:hypothetical protein